MNISKSLKFLGYILCGISLFILAISNYEYIYDDGFIYGIPVINVKNNVHVAWLLFPGVAVLLIHLVLNNILNKKGK